AEVLTVRRAARYNRRERTRRNLRSKSGGLMSHRTEGDTSMEFFRTLNRALAGLADRLQGQDVERSAAPEVRRGADHAAIMRSHHSQGIGSRPAHSADVPAVRNRGDAVMSGCVLPPQRPAASRIRATCAGSKR